MRRKTKKELYGDIAERLYVDSGLDLPEIHEHYLPHVSVTYLEQWRANGRWRQKITDKSLSAGKIAEGIEGMMLELAQEKTVGNADAMQKLNKALQNYKSVSEAHFPERAVEVFERFKSFLTEHISTPGKRQEIFGYVRGFLETLQ